MKNYYKKTILGISTLLIFLFSSPLLRASHMAGSEITYTCVGPNQYQVKLVTYRDCSGISPDASALIRYASTACGVNATFQLSLQSSTDITPLCGSVASACNGGGGPVGVEKIVYTGILTLPNGCSDWVLSYDLCCRNGSITNLSNPSGEDIYVQTTLNNTLSGCNSSPQFASVPQLFGCVGNTIHFQQLASDPDGDQLVYSLITASSNPGTSVVYSGGFGGTNPFNVPATIDPNTGEVTVTPTVAQVAVLAILIQEYRGGVLIGSVVRDLQINISNCTNALPEIGGINGVVNDYDISVCANAQLCFTVAITDANAGQLITAATSNLPAGATVTVTGTGNNETATICWTPTTADIGTHYITINAEDNACPFIGENSKVLAIQVVANPNPPVNAGVDATICAGASTLLSATSSAGNISSITWSPPGGLSGTSGASVTANPGATTTYSVTMIYSDGCTSVDAVQVTVAEDPAVSVVPGNISVCGGSSVMLTGTTNNTGMNFQWFNPAMTSLGAGTLSGTVSTINVTPPVAAGSYTYTVRVTNPVTGCSSDAAATVVVGAPSTLPACVNIYASPTGSAASPGTQSNPTTLANALSLAQCNNAVIKLAIGTYTIDNPLYLSSFVTIEGGFDPGSSWIKSSLAGATTITRSTANPEGTAGSRRLVAFYGNSVQSFRFQDLTITTANANEAGMSTYGIHLTNCSSYNIVRTQVLPGSAFAGMAGIAGANGTTGGAGGNGSAGDIDDQEDAGAGGGGGGGGGTTAGATGSNATGNYNAANNCSLVGGNGGAAGTSAGAGGKGANDANGCGCCANGTSGVAGGISTAAQSGGGGGGGGSGGEENGSGGAGAPGGGVQSVYGANTTAGAGGAESVDGGNGGNGAAGINGTTGTAGTAGSHVAGFWVPGNQGGTGGAGSGGQGGKGGGGGGGQGCTFCVDGSGSGGGGGGGGGQGAYGGTGGTGGGASFGIYLYNNGTGGNVIQSRVVSGAAGAGGAGGIGGTGGNGGVGGLGSPYGGSEVGGGGNGGSGGKGGNGGTGGAGSAGVSINVNLNGGSALSTNDNTFNLPGQPVIRVVNVNCTNTNVTYTSAASNTWDFDLTTNNATPAGATGASVVTQYSQVARYSVSYGVNNYTGFHNIAYSGGLIPEITTNAVQIATDVYQLCEGQYANFQSVYSADSYIWNFNGAITNPGSVQNVNAQFNTPGYFAITLTLVTDCCGSSTPKTIYLHVLPNPNVTASGTNALCSTGSVVLTVNGLTAANNLSWSPVTSIVFQTANSITVNPSGNVVYHATVTSTQTAGGTTATGCPVTLNFPITVNAIPQVNLTANNVSCNNNGSVSSAPTPAGTYTYAWSNGASGSSISNLASGNYAVTITNTITGCQNTDSIFVYPTNSQPNLFVASNSAACEGSANGSSVIQTVGGSPAYTINWNGISYPNTATLSQTNLAGGIYPVTVTDNNGCSSNLLVTVPEIEAPHVMVTPGTIPCAGNSGTFYVSGTDGAILTYNFGGTNNTMVLSHHDEEIVLTNLMSTVTMNLVSVNGQCSTPLNSSYTLVVDPCGLGVNLLDFKASCINRVIDFSWTTLSEINNDFFTLEGSPDGMNYQTIEVVDGSGTTQSSQVYHTSFERTDPRITYFRLNQTDFDGLKTSYFPITVDCAPEEEFTLYPNPSDGQFVIEMYLAEQVKSADFRILDLTGRVLNIFKRELTNDLNHIYVDMSDLPKGEYLIEVILDDKTPMVKRFVIQ